MSKFLLNNYVENIKHAIRNLKENSKYPVDIDNGECWEEVTVKWW